MPFRITETAGFIALSVAGRLEAWIAACSASVTRRSSCFTCSRKDLSSSCVCAVAAWGRPSAAETASAMVAFLYMLSLQVHAIANTAALLVPGGTCDGKTKRELEERANRIRSAQQTREEGRPTLSSASLPGAGRSRAQGPPVRCLPRDTRCTVRRDG